MKKVDISKDTVVTKNIRGKKITGPSKYFSREEITSAVMSSNINSMAHALEAVHQAMKK